MKNPVRNVVVEYKNKRGRNTNASLWGNLDLKSISREVETDIPQSPAEIDTPSAVSEPPVNVKKNTVRDDLSAIASDEDFEDAQTTREPSVVETVELEKVAADHNPVPKLETSEKIAIKQKKQSVRRTQITALPQQHEAVTLSVTDRDLRTELAFLESENASLKRELCAKLHLENDELSQMHARIDQRAAHKK